MQDLDKPSLLTILNDDDTHLRFLLNLPIEVQGIGELHSPTLNEIISLTETKYNVSVSCVLLDKDNIEQDVGDFTNFQIAMQQAYSDLYFREVFLEGLNLHFNTQAKWYQDEQYAFVYFDELTNDSVLTEEKFNYIQHLIKIANNIDTKKEEYNAANKAAQKLIEKIKKKKKETNVNDKKINLHSIISSVLWKNNSFNIINQLNIYQLYDAYQRTMEIDNYHFTMNGVYAGTVDSKSVKMPDIFWAKKIN